MTSLLKTSTKRLGTGTPASDDAARWDMVASRDKAADGRFVSAVRTTGIYCRPSCAARPKRENVSFYASNAEAEAGGYRACKRCKPEQITRA